jgi:monoamine oxidase
MRHPTAGWLSLALFALLVACGDTHHGSEPAQRVVVVGAGLAGMTAALDLRDAGWDVVVLEARDRVGGRVHTLRDPFTDGLHAEAGGESIDDNHDAIQALAHRYGLPLEQRTPNRLLSGAAYYQGARYPVIAFALRPGVLDSYDSFSAALLDLSTGMDPEHPELFPGAAALDQRSLADFLSEQALLPEAEFLTNVSERAIYASELSGISLLWAAQQARVVADVPDSASETMRISGGNDRLPLAMAADLGSIVRLNSPVTRVAERTGSVRVATLRDEVEAAFVVMAIPTPPMRQITFDPPLPADLRAMVAELQLGAAVKVISQYDRRFWNDLSFSGFTISDLPFGIAWSSSDSYESSSGLMTQFITGSAAVDASALDDATRIAQFQSQLDTVYPEGATHHANGAATMAWLNEPYTGGAYAVYAPGQLTRFWPAVRAGTARIRFAGEYTETLAGYMESAVRSGHRIAMEIGSPPR